MRLLLAIALALLAVVANAATSERLSDPAQEARARTLQRELRCMVCQGESLDESNAPLAADLRRIIREHIAAGDSDDEIKAFMVERYGDFILMKPPLRKDTVLLWLAPGLLLLIGGAGVILTVRHARRRGTTPPQY